MASEEEYRGHLIDAISIKLREQSEKKLIEILQMLASNKSEPYQNMLKSEELIKGSPRHQIDPKDIIYGDFAKDHP